MNISKQVEIALNEDVQTGDITASLIPEDNWGYAQIMARVPAVVCGQAWVNEVFRQVDARITLNWHVEEGGARQSSGMGNSCRTASRNIDRRANGA